MGKLECLVRKTKKIEGNDVGAILGLDKYRSIADVYEEKTEEIETSQGIVEASYWTNTLEEVISREFMIRTKMKIRKNNINSTHKEFEFMASNVNRKIIGENSILDCRVMSGINEDDVQKKEFIKMNLLGAQHNMMVKNADKCYIAILVNGKKLILREAKRNENLISKIVKCEERFWNDYIIKKVKPKEPLSLENLD